MRTLPKLVTILCYNHEAWIVGSAANPDNTEPRDYDVVLSHAHWHGAAALVPTDAKVNAFGGWKCQSEGFEVDVWPGDLSWLLTNNIVEWVWHPRTGVRFRKHPAM